MRFNDVSCFLLVLIQWNIVKVVSTSNGQCVIPCLYCITDSSIQHIGDVYNYNTKKQLQTFNTSYSYSDNVPILKSSSHLKKIFWYNHDKIHVSSYIPSFKLQLFKLDIGEIVDFEIYNKEKLLLWTDQGYNVIGGSSINGDNQFVFLQIDKPCFIAISQTQSFIFYTTNQNKKYQIWKSNFQKTKTQIVEVSKEISSIYIDQEYDILYYSLKKQSNSLKSIDFDGKNAVNYKMEAVKSFVIRRNVEDTVFIYYIKEYDINIYNRTLSPYVSQANLIANTESYPYPSTLSLYDTARVNPSDSLCENIGCSHICLHADNTGFLCQCPNGYKLKSDKKTCIVITFDVQLISLVTHSDIVERIKITGNVSVKELYDTGKYTSPVKILQLNNAVLRRNEIVCFDETTKLIIKIDIMHCNVTVLTSKPLSNVTQLQYDWNSKSIYYFDSKLKQVVGVYLNGEKRMLINPTSNDQIQKFIFSESKGIILLVVKSGNFHRVYKYGKPNDKNTIGQYVGEITYDSNTDILYFYNTQTKTIKELKLASGVSNVRLNGITDVKKLFFDEHNGFIYWLDISLRLYSANMKLTNPKTIFLRNITFHDDIAFEALTISSTLSQDSAAYNNLCLTGNNGCSHFCFNDPLRCECPENMTLATDSKLCQPANKVNKVINCEHSNNQKGITCNNNEVISIIDALYGRMVSSICPTTLDGSNCKSLKSLSVVKGLCEGKTQCQVNASNSLFGDPCVHKYLEVEYQCLSYIQASVCSYPCLYFVKNENLKRASLNQDGYIIPDSIQHVLSTKMKNIKAFDINYNNEKIFWSDGKSVFQSDTSGQNLKVLINEGNVHGLLVDYRNNLLYLLHL